MCEPFDPVLGDPGPDRPHADALCAAARAAGLRVFIDLDLLLGADVTVALPDALERSRVFAGIVSPRRDEGWHEKDGAAHATDLQRTTPGPPVPLLTRPCPLLDPYTHSPTTARSARPGAAPGYRRAPRRDLRLAIARRCS